MPTTTTPHNALPPEPMRGHWIDVRDHLPAEDEIVLIYDLQDDETYCAAWTAHETTGEPVWYDPYSPSDGLVLYTPFQWMAMPRPRIASLHPSLQEIFKLAPAAAAAAIN